MAKQQHLNLSQAAALVGRSERWVSQLRERGYIRTPKRGEYPVVAVLRGAMAYFEDKVASQADDAQKTATTDARTLEIELRIQQKREKLIDADVPGEVMDEFFEMAAHEMRAMPARVYKDRTKLNALAAEVEASLARIQKQSEAAKRRLQTGDL